MSSTTGYPRLYSLYFSENNNLSNFVFSLSDQTMEKQAENLRNISSKYEHDKKYWTAAINELHEKIKVRVRHAIKDHILNHSINTLNCKGQKCY